MLDIYYIIIYNAWVHVDMEFFFECLHWQLTSEHSSSPFLRRKSDFINEWK